MSDKKKVGEVFDLLLKCNQPARDTLLASARTATFAENALWLLWRLHDPVTPGEFVRRRAVKEATGKWEKLPVYRLEHLPDGETPTKIAGHLCPGLPSCVYDAIANSVARLYMKNRMAYLGFWERLPMCKDLRIRFREKAVLMRRNPDHPRWFQVGLRLTSPCKGKTEITWMDFHTGGKSEHTLRWLADVCDGKALPSGGCVSAKKKHGVLRWQFTQARPRYEGEREQVHPVPGRSLVCYAPPDGEEFLYMQVTPVRGRPWRQAIESNDMLLLKMRDARLRQAMGRNYHQSPYSSAHGHGRTRAIRGKLAFSSRYERRVNSWIENRSAAIVSFARDMKCEKIQFEKLTERDPSTLRLGSFPYFRLMERTKQKAADAGIDWATFADFESIMGLLSGDGEKDNGSAGG